MSSLNKPDWAAKLEELLRKLGLTQEGLAEKLSVSPMTVSRWVRGTHRPTAETYIKLANLAGSPDNLYFWEQAGFTESNSPAHFFDGKSIHTSVVAKLSAFEMADGPRISATSKDDLPDGVAIPLLDAKVHAASAGIGPPPDLDALKVSQIMTAPLEWCTNTPALVGLIVQGDSMSPLIEDGSVIIVDTASTDVPMLDRKIVVASHRDQGLKACWLRQVGTSQMLVPENSHYAPEEYSANKNWSLLGEVVWWITTPPKR